MVTSRWIYKLKHVADGSVEKYKAWFVARCFSQVDEVDYDETYALVAHYTSIRALISIAAEMGWKIHQMDVKTAFLDGILQEEVVCRMRSAHWFFDVSSQLSARVVFFGEHSQSVHG